MLELLDSLTSDSLVMICLVLGVIALCLAIGISVEIYTSNKKYQEENGIDKSLETTQSRLNIKESENVKYVEEDRELEKTKAKMELEQLREKLMKEEEEKQRIIEENLALEAKKQEPQIETLEDTIVNLKPVNIEYLDDEETNPNDEIHISDIVNEPVEEITNTVEIEKTKEITPIVEQLDPPVDENEAIISYDELKNAKNFGYTDEEMYNNVDEKDAIISVQELEKLYSESKEIEPVKEEKNNDDSVNTSSYNSSAYTYSKTDQDLVLEQTANLEKLNEEIRKTNEFLKMLKDLKKNLD